MPASECPAGCYAGVVIDGPSEVHVCERCHVPHAEIGGPAEARAAAGKVGQRAFMLWRRGQNLAGRGPFPLPIAEPETGPVFDLRAVRAWHKGPSRSR